MMWVLCLKIHLLFHVSLPHRTLASGFPCKQLNIVTSCRGPDQSGQVDGNETMCRCCCLIPLLFLCFLFLFFFVLGGGRGHGFLPDDFAPWISLGVGQERTTDTGPCTDTGLWFSDLHAPKPSHSQGVEEGGSVVC